MKLLKKRLIFSNVLNTYTQVKAKLYSFKPKLATRNVEESTQEYIQPTIIKNTHL